MSDCTVATEMMEDLEVTDSEPARLALNAGNALLKALTGRVGLLVMDSMTGILCARMLGPQGRGELAAMILWPVFLCQAFTLGVPSALIFSIRTKPKQAGTMIAGAFALAIIASLITIAFGFTLLPHWLTHYEPGIVLHAKWFMMAAPISMAVLILRGIWEANGEFGKSALSLLGTRVLTLTVLVVLALSRQLTSISASYTYLLTGIPAVLFMSAAIIPRAEWSLKPVFDAVRSMLSYGLRSYGIDLCGALSQYVDQALVLGMLTAMDMGTYTVALSLSRILNAIAVAASSVLFPKAIGATPRQAVLMAIRTQITVSVIAGIGATGMLLLGDLALGLLYGREYLAATLTLKILIVEAVLSGAVTIMSQPFMALGRPGIVTTLQISGLLTSIPFIIVLVPRYGTEGACIALVLSAFVRIVLLGVCYARVLPGVVVWREDVPAEAAKLFRAALKRFNDFRDSTVAS